jgi:NDP-sugar pyrophosphorylase family protein
VDVGAIVLVEAQSQIDESSSPSSVADFTAATSFAGEALSLVDVLGRTLVEHTIDRLRSAEVKITSLVVHPDIAQSIPAFRRPLGNLNICVANDPWPAVAQILDNYSKNGCDCAFLVKPTAYLEADLSDLLDFHRQAERALTRASDGEGPLNLWVMNCDPNSETFESSLHAALLQPDSFPASYFVKEYVRRIFHAQDFRQLVTDAFLARCGLRPNGEQLRPGVWVDQGVQVGRGARIVGPAYLGARCTIGERAVITRCSNIECDSYIDYGTVVENSSVLPNTYVGMGLDVRRSVVQGNRLLNLERGVLVEVSDPRLLCAKTPVRSSKRTPEPVPKHRYENSPPRATIVDRIRSISTSTEFES